MKRDMVRIDMRDFTCRFGKVGNGFDNLVMIGANAITSEPVRVCAFARRTLGEATARACRNGMYVITSKSRLIVYELFPVEFSDGKPTGIPVMLGVKRSDVRY